MRNDDSTPDAREPEGTDDAGAPADGAHAPAPTLPVVVIGASAGALEPLRAFLRAVPGDSGFAYVIVQHRPRNADNRLTELLSRSTNLPVATAQEALTLIPDHVYVAPPGRYAAVRDGRFEILEDTAARHRPVDYLLRSLLQERDLDPMAVILSGTGTDGTLGVKAVKGHEGIAAAQDPGEAEHRGMPDSAIETGEVDLVLPAASIPARLIGVQPHRRSPGEEPDESAPGALTRIFALLRERSGHDFSRYKRTTVMRRLSRRMTVNNTPDLADYSRLLHHNTDEQDTLFREMLIRVSGFFRDPEAFASLERNVMPDLAARAAGAPDRGIRVWVPGCATGEEAYSLGILIDEAMQARGCRAPVQIFATDIDPEAIALARAGRYSQSIAPDVSRARLARYFETDGNDYRVREALRDMMVFAEHNVLRDPPFSSIDLLSCRNLLIYLETDVQSRLLPVFHYALSPGGYLVLGSSEGLADGAELFQPVDAGTRIFSRVNGMKGDKRPPIPPHHRGGRRDRERPRTNASNPASSGIETIAERVLLRDHVPACVVVDDDDRILHFRGRTSRFLEPATGAPTLNIREMIRGDLARSLREVMRRARRGDETAVSRPLDQPDSDGARVVRLRASPVHESGVPGGSMLVAFELLPPWADGAVPERSADDDEQVRLLKQELKETREDLRATVEDLETSNQALKAANEDLQSSNEELQSSNEELETSREELQSVNEALYTVNGELERKVEELSLARDDINNLLASTDIGLVFVDRELRIRHFTPAVRRIVPLRDTDRGRPFGDFSATIGTPDLNAVLSEVLRTGADREQALQGSDGTWYLMRARPYLASRSRVSGVVLAFVDMALTHASHGAWLTGLLNLSPAPVAVTDLDGRIARANRRLGALSGYDPERLVDRGLPELLAGMESGQWRAMRAALLDARIWHDDSHLCHRDGSHLPVTVTFAPLVGSSDTVSEALVHITQAPP